VRQERRNVLGRENERTVGPGEIVIVPPETLHAFVNNGP
jgi:quercetin dioxygenase-like cupin family protein